MNLIGRICTGLLLATLQTQFVAVAGEGDRQKKYSEKQLAQQQRMTDCSAEAKASAMRGEARMAFMKTCLAGGSVTVVVGEESASAPDDPSATDGAAMKACEAEASQQSMSACLAN